MARNTASARTKAAAVAVARKVENAAETRASLYRHAGKTMSGRPDVGAALLRVAGMQDALAELKKLKRPFLNWAGQAERLSFEVPTMPLFVHERLSTSAIIQTLEAHRKQPEQSRMTLFADPQRPLSEQVRAFEHRDAW